MQMKLCVAHKDSDSQVSSVAAVIYGEYRTPQNVPLPTAALFTNRCVGNVTSYQTEPLRFTPRSNRCLRIEFRSGRTDCALSASAQGDRYHCRLAFYSRLSCAIPRTRLCSPNIEPEIISGFTCPPHGASQYSHLRKCRTFLSHPLHWVQHSRHRSQKLELALD